MSLTAIELCAGGGGQALGLEMAGFHHVAAVEYEPHYCTTLRTNRPHWKVVEDDIRNFRSQDYSDIDLVAGGVPCLPFSIAGKQLGSDDRNLGNCFNCHFNPVCRERLAFSINFV